MKIKLIANGSRPWERWIRRWGLSFLIDDDILFDAFGDARVLMGNLRRFKVDVNKIQHVVISHEHWDHVEGLQLLLRQVPGLKIYLPQQADNFLKNRIRAWGGNVIQVSHPVKLKEGIYASGEIMGRYADNNMPEQAMVLETGKGLVIIAGCAHPGVLTIVKHAKKAFGKPVNAVIGGCHLKDHSQDDIRAVAYGLKGEGVEMVFPLHCTGAKAQKIFKQVFGSGCLFFREGQQILL